MKKILVGFLTIACLSLSISARLPLLQRLYIDKSNPLYSSNKQIDNTYAKSFSSAKLTIKGGYFKRLFQREQGHFIPPVGKIIHTWHCVGFLTCSTVLFFSFHLFSICPRSPPVKPCF